MPALSFFACERDVDILIERLNTDNEVAFIVPDATEDRRAPQWKAVRTVSALRDGEHSLWHIPAGPLPWPQNATGIGPIVRPPDPPVPDPWAGWVEKTGVVGAGPWLGPGAHSEIRLTLWTRYKPYTSDERSAGRPLISYWGDGREFLACSTFQWTGSRFRPAPTQTTRWWNRLKAWVSREAVKLPTRSRDVTFWSFPFALELLKRGVAYDANNWSLDDAIRQAQPRTSQTRER
jgi:hypothetical protein